MEWYLDLINRTLDEGIWVNNSRTGKSCLTVINADFEWDSSQGYLPILTTKQVAWKPAIAELLGYIRGYESAAQFRELGTKTWDMNANQNKAWLQNIARKGDDDMGIVYGAAAQQCPNLHGQPINTMDPVFAKIARHEDDRGLIITFWNPGLFPYGCLRPCLHTWHFSILNETLYLTTYQRSADIPLGLPFNLIQGHTLLCLVAQASGLKVGKLFMKFTNLHIYEDQLKGIIEQRKRTPIPPHTQLEIINVNEFTNLKKVTLDNFSLGAYKSYPSIKFPFSV